MGYRGNQPPSFQANFPLTDGVKKLIIVNVAIWLGLQIIVEKYFLSHPHITENLGLTPGIVLSKFFVWQFGTYMFLHDPTNIFHIIFNMLVLWWMGSELENRWGKKFFITYYLVSGIGAAVIYFLGTIFFLLVTSNVGGLLHPVIGASGAIFGLLLAYGMVFGERVVYFMMIFPMKAKHLVMLLGGVEIVSMLTHGIGQSRIANLAHLGGLVSGFLFLWGWTKYKQKRRRKSSSGSRRNLKLVVSNEDEKDPKYWN